MSSPDTLLSSPHSTLKKPNYVVGIGASAGGLEALEVLFENMPIDSGMAFVVIQHLSPEHKSLMDELLARKTPMSVYMSEEQMTIQANCVYLLPPKKEMIISNGRLLLTEREADEILNLPINTFFYSLAESYQDKAIAVILSGSGSDGSKGVHSVHDSGGMVIAQEPQSCQFDSMPKSAINSHQVDQVLSPENIPQALIKYGKRTDKITQQISAGNFNVEESQFTEILILINNRLELDFSQYKTSTITRRIERRMGLSNIASLKDYLNILLSSEEELEALYYDLLIGVTQFFRDPEAFVSLKKLLPSIIESFLRSEEPELRVWIPGCATGEEAYSIGILLSELNLEMGETFPFKVFATDVHHNSIKKAALGIYPEQSFKPMDKSYLKRYFNALGDGRYQVSPNLRRNIVFAQHNVIKDAPFTKTHLITCRNLLIYFNLETQRKVLSLLTFALRNHGLLFLGPSETLGRHATHYRDCDSNNKIFEKIRDTYRNPSLGFVTSMKPRIALSMNSSVKTSDYTATLKSKKALHILLQKYVPPSLLINSLGEILHIFGDVGDFLSMEPGETSLNLKAMVSGPAKAVITQMLNHIQKTQKPLKTEKVEGFANCLYANVEIQNLSESTNDSDYLLVSITPQCEEIKEHDLDTDSSITLEPNVSSRITELEEELQFTKESLHTTLEELETSNEELQSSNEELIASNEELQSTNEELQSVNEELITVNAEFKTKELERAEIVADEKSALEASGVIFLDENLFIRKFSGMAAEIFYLVPGDQYRPITAISGDLIQSLIDTFKQVLLKGGLFEKEINLPSGSIYLMRIRRLEPMDDASNKPRGLILTFFDITKLYNTRKQLQQSEQRFQSIVNVLSDGYFEWQPKTNKLYISNMLKQQLGYEDTRELTWNDLLMDSSQTFLEAISMKQSGNDKSIINLKNASGKETWYLCKYRTRQLTSLDEDKRIEGLFIDMESFKNLEADLKLQMRQLKRSNDMLEEFAYVVSHDLKAPLRHSLHSLAFIRDAHEKNNEEKITKYIERLESYLGSLQSLIDDVIQFSRLRTQKKRVDKINLNDIIERIRPILESNYPDKSLEMYCEKLPLIECDGSMISHLFQNLLHNACKYNNKEDIRIEVISRIEDKKVTIFVIDNGIGFEQSFAQDIFKPFKRLVTKAQYEGSGVGLAICKTIVEQHDGEIRAESTPGLGSQFIFTLPIKMQIQ